MTCRIVILSEAKDLLSALATRQRVLRFAQDDKVLFKSTESEIVDNKIMAKPIVSIVMGSDSDLEIMREAGKALEEFGIGYEIDVTSAHRSPDRTADFARKAAGRGIQVIIGGAGGGAHLG